MLRVARAGSVHSPCLPGGPWAGGGPRPVRVLADHLVLDDGRCARTLAVAAYPRQVGSGWLDAMFAFAAEMRAALHVEPIDSGEAVDELTRHARTLQASLILSDARHGLRDASDESALEDALALRESLARGDVRLFRLHLLVTLFAEDVVELQGQTGRLMAELHARMILVRGCRYEQSGGYASTLPLQRLQARSPRNFDSDALCTALPYVGGAFQAPAEEVWGIDIRYGSIVAVDRYALPNAHMLCVAASGAGKSFWLKSVLTQTLLAGRGVVLVDPQSEYAAWCRALGGRWVELSPRSDARINPLDPGRDAAPAESGGPSGPGRHDPAPGGRGGAEGLAPWQAAAGETLLEALCLLGALGPAERAAVWAALAAAYRSLAGGAQVPTLGEVALRLRGGDAAGRRVAAILDPALRGALLPFDGQTNVGAAGHLTVFDVSKVVAGGGAPAAAACHLLAEHLGAASGGSGGQRTVAVDEAHYLLAHAPSARLVERLFRTGRKRGLGVCLVTQSVGDLLGREAATDAARAARAALANAATVFMMRQQNAREAQWLQELYRLSPADAEWLIGCPQGQGLLRCGVRGARVRVEAPERLHGLFGSGPAVPAGGGPRDPPP